MWNLRIYALLCCVGLLGRWSYRAALRELDGDKGVQALFLFWIPLVALVCIGLSYLLPWILRLSEDRWKRLKR